MNSICTQKLNNPEQDNPCARGGDGSSHAYIIVHQYFDLQAETHTHTKSRNELLLWTIKHVFLS
jgi:hypothetical protein